MNYDIDDLKDDRQLIDHSYASNDEVEFEDPLQDDVDDCEVLRVSNINRDQLSNISSIRSRIKEVKSLQKGDFIESKAD